MFSADHFLIVSSETSKRIVSLKGDPGVPAGLVEIWDENSNESWHVIARFALASQASDPQTQNSVFFCI